MPGKSRGVFLTEAQQLDLKFLVRQGRTGAATQNLHTLIGEKVLGLLEKIAEKLISRN